MVRGDYITEVIDYADLISFCLENDMSDELGIVCNASEMSDAIDSDIRDAIPRHHWADIRRYLGTIPESSGTGYFRYLGTFAFEALDNDDFESDKQFILEIADERGLFEGGLTREERIALEAAEAERREREAETQVCAKLTDFLGEEMIA